MGLPIAYRKFSGNTPPPPYFPLRMFPGLHLFLTRRGAVIVYRCIDHKIKKMAFWWPKSIPDHISKHLENTRKKKGFWFLVYRHSFGFSIQYSSKNYLHEYYIENPKRCLYTKYQNPLFFFAWFFLKIWKNHHNRYISITTN